MLHALGRFNHQRPGRHGHFLLVDRELNLFRSAMCSPYRLATHQQIRRPVGAFPLQVVFEFVPPFFHDADRRHCRGIAQRAKSLAQHVFSKLADQSEYLRCVRRRRGSGPTSSAATPCLRGRECTSRTIRARKNA